jgi:PAS domain S-box-containing protein
MAKPLRVLLVEDSEDDAFLLISALKDGGYEPAFERVETSEELKSALSRKEWDCIISDYSMPQFDGLAALREVQARGIDVPFIIVSGTIGEDTAVGAMKAGAHDYIVKDKLARLIPALQRELADVEVRRKRKQAEEALRASEEQFRLITENVADLIAVLDLEGRCVYNSPMYRNIIGDPESLRGTDSFQEIHPDDRERVKAIFRETVKTGEGRRAEYRFLKKDGTICYIESQKSVIRDDSGKITNVVVVSRDITDKKILEQQLLRAQRLESIGTLAGGVAHDLNNVLSPILLSIEILKKSIRDEQSRLMLLTLESSARRGSDIVRQILAFARGMEGERALIQLRHVASETIAMIKQTFPKSIKVKEDIPKDTWTIFADATQLQQLIMNLGVNARDAMPDGGTLAISAENKNIDEQFARTHIDAMPGKYVKFSVRDTGTGMPPEIVDRIFEPFFTTKEVGKGTGLGLSTVRTIVKSHGGFIDVHSEPGKGSVFEIYFPVSGISEASKLESEVKKLCLGNGECILVVDDEASICQITKLTLEAFGYRVITAADGSEAVVQYRLRGKDIALVLTDMMMPVLDGQGTIRALRKMNPAVKIIAASGVAADSYFTPNGDIPADAYIAKPYSAEQLLKIVDRVLHGERK